MKIFSDARCLGYETPGHPEARFRVESTEAAIRAARSDWAWPSVEEAPEASLLLAHSAAHLERLRVARDFDADTAYHEGIDHLARLTVGSALGATRAALARDGAFSLMRPPGHHAERERAMGFCYLNSVAICALQALRDGVSRVAIWDFDAHHGNGTEAILSDVPGVLYVSAHQHPCYPGTGAESHGNCRNFPVAPFVASAEHMAILERSWDELLEFEPELVLVSAGFDAYVHDPITQMSLGLNDFHTLGQWLGGIETPVAAILEGGYSEDLPQLILSFLEAWER